MSRLVVDVELELVEQELGEGLFRHPPLLVAVLACVREMRERLGEGEGERGERERRERERERERKRERERERERREREQRT